VAPQGGVPRAASSVRVRGEGVRALVTGPGSASLCHRIRCHAAMRISDESRRFISRGAHGGADGSRSIVQPRPPANPPCSW
jgi:hypothetical protein